MIRKPILNLILITISLFVVSCVTVQNIPSMESGFENDLSNETIKQEEPIESDNLPKEKLSTKINELVEKGKSQTNYQYSFTGRVITDKGTLKELPKYDAYIKDDKVKKVYKILKRLEQKIFFDEAHLDNSKKTAFGTCSLGGSCSSDYRNLYPLNYSEELLSITPVSILSSIQPNARIVETKLLDGKSLVIIEFINKEGYVESLSVYDYSGLPYERKVFTYRDDERVLLEEYTFNRQLLNQLKNADVSLPDRFVTYQK